MIAKALICSEKQEFTLEPVVIEEPSGEELLVRTLYSGVSIGTEFALIRNKISWGPYPLCTGYQGVGVVEQVGAQVADFSVGDVVYFRDNLPFRLASGEAVSSVTGTHCSHIRINPRTTHGLARLPEGVSPEVGSLFVMPAVGFKGVDMANPRLGELVVVYGAGLIGLGVIAACSLRGCRVLAIDVHEPQLAMARKLGADYCVNSTTEDADAALRALAPEGGDVVFECTGIPACVNQALPLARNFGSFVMQGNYGLAPISFDFTAAHARTLTMYFPMDDGQGPARRAVLKNMAQGALPWECTITHRVTPEEAPALYTRINTGQAGDVVGAVIKWGE
ncbi:MAG TPA: zinc-binding alcohol dehydrogenase [Armatimonadota bacterium]|jgi:2-desacetyl-2-hydroxyethyl bacteriochlorophyllide A dehydrogenase